MVLTGVNEHVSRRSAVPDTGPTYHGSEREREPNDSATQRLV